MLEQLSKLQSLQQQHLAPVRGHLVSVIAAIAKGTWPANAMLELQLLLHPAAVESVPVADVMVTLPANAMPERGVEMNGMSINI
jgi:hypothetical protein